MISSSKYLIFSIFFVCIFNGALCRFGNTYLHMQCSKFVEPINPKLECKYGYERNICNKTSCLKGPDEVCQEEWGTISERCAGTMMCCGICVGCHDNKCSSLVCDSNLIAAKRTPSKPLWITDYYQQRMSEKRRLQQIQQQQQQQQQQEEERQRMQLMASPRDFLNLKSSVDRYPYYPFTNNFEYSNNDD
ncbi:uncharacterized protein LOC129578280 [Sitodiplosis mosellana]|uniref:uncharacterized protein LOC129578280 n=1 Tax=Sitodiplosis mosellana TaxID=263140 RepID=UPI002444093A|nr:uncharacterized protein LOC129578280 [Sitodiplosis mosellana]